MRATLDQTERLLEKYGPADFDQKLDAFAEVIEYVTVVEIRRAWAASYETVDGFYETHEYRHPRIRVYSAARRELAAANPLRSTGESPTQLLDRLWRARERRGRARVNENVERLSAD